jgi:thioredoxin 1
MASDLLKKCPSCKKTDVTSFSTCRYCGTKYSAKIEEPKSYLDQKVLAVFAMVAICCGIGYYITSTLKAEKAKNISALVSEIKAANRPRVIEFYADWCGPCRAYGPVVEECRGKFSGRVDFERLNVDDPNSRDLAQKLEVSAIPKTCFFSRNGEETGEVVGGIDSSNLEERVQSLLAN